ncbi:MAG: DUF3604 domain-containing protein, partial [Halieaceae bacterium]|nr:DUF3604 domain-containing protein [Halieaceae bacterium]
MIKKTLLTLLGLVLLTVAVGWFGLGKELYERQNASSPATAADDYALQDDSKVQIPEQEAHITQPYNPLKNVYWGDLHVHTVESLDAVLFGTTLTVQDAYRFSKGDSLRSPGGELMQLSRPLDFVAITDHAESFGLRTRCRDEDLTLIEQANCWLMETPNIAVFSVFRAMAADDD